MFESFKPEEEEEENTQATQQERKRKLKPESVKSCLIIIDILMSTYLKRLQKVLLPMDANF